eukprot:2329972-Rhodomonas_salina.1
MIALTGTIVGETLQSGSPSGKRFSYRVPGGTVTQVPGYPYRLGVAYIPGSGYPGRNPVRHGRNCPQQSHAG